MTINKLIKKKSNTAHIFLESVGKNEWRFVYNKNFRKLLDEFYDACEIMDAGRYQEASLIFNKIINLAPEFFDAYNSLAMILMVCDQKNEGLICLETGFEKALTLFPKNFFEKPNKLEWGWLENRGFLRSYANLGLYYLEKNKTLEAKLIFERIITMNPNDNQGIRDPLLSCYFKLHLLEEAFKLCSTYDGDMLVAMTYGKALLLYIQENEKGALNQLTAAVEFSPRVIKELLKSRNIKPKDYGEGPGILLGGSEEAYEYCKIYKKYWVATPGAMLFLNKFWSQYKNRKG